MNSDSGQGGAVVNTAKDIPPASIRIEGRPIAVRSRKVDRAAGVAVDFRVAIQDCA
jgi:hypothetical protein